MIAPIAEFAPTADAVASSTLTRLSKRSRIHTFPYVKVTCIDGQDVAPHRKGHVVQQTEERLYNQETNERIKRKYIRDIMDT